MNIWVMLKLEKIPAEKLRGKTWSIEKGGKVEI